MGVRLGGLDGRYGDYSIYVLSAGKLLHHHSNLFLIILSHSFRVKTSVRICKSNTDITFYFH